MKTAQNVSKCKSERLTCRVVVVDRTIYLSKKLGVKRIMILLEMFGFVWSRFIRIHKFGHLSRTQLNLLQHVCGSEESTYAIIQENLLGNVKGVNQICIRLLLGLS